MALAVCGLMIVVGLAVGSGTLAGVVAAVALTGITVMAGLTTWFGLRRVVLGLALVATVMVSWVGVRVGPAVAVSDIFFFAASGLLIPYRFQNRSFTFKPYLFSVIAIVLVVTGGLLGTFFAAEPIASLSQLARFSSSTVSVIVFFALLSPTRREVEFFASAFVLGALVSGVIALILAETTYGRPSGLSQHPNHLGLVAFMAIGILLGVSRLGRRRLSMGAVVLLVVVAVASGSRASIAGVFLTSFLFLCANGGIVVMRRLVIAVAIATAVWSLGWGGIPNDAIGRLLGDEPVAEANSGRADVGSASLERISEHPLTGSGFSSALEAHSVYLQLWQGAGLFGLAGLAMLWITALQALRRGRQRGNGLLVGLASGYLAYLMVVVVGNQLWNRYIWVTLALMIAAKAAPDQAGQEAVRSERRVMASSAVLDQSHRTRLTSGRLS